MPPASYIFEDASQAPELHRLRDLGQVVALDTNPRFLTGLGARVQVVEGDLLTSALPGEHFDWVHARYVLIHNADARALLGEMLRVLKPGGTLLLEEPDFSAARALVGPQPAKLAFDQVRGAMESLFAARGMAYDFGRALPELVANTGSSLVRLDYDCSAARGGSALAEMMRLSTHALRDKYVATGRASELDLSQYADFASSPDCWGVYYATVRVLARKPAAPA